MVNTKKCNVCNNELHISNFYFRKESGKYRNNCKKCKPLLSKAKIIEIANSNRKVCKHCGIEKDRTEFQLACKGKYTQPYCKLCDAERKRIYSVKNIEKVRRSRKEYYAKNKENILAKERERVRSKPKIKIEANRNLYEVSLHKGKTPDQYTWLEWDKPVSDEALRQIVNYAKKEGVDLTVNYYTGEEIPFEKYYSQNTDPRHRQESKEKQCRHYR